MKKLMLYAVLAGLFLSTVGTELVARCCKKEKVCCPKPEPKPCPAPCPVKKCCPKVKKCCPKVKKCCPKVKKCCPKTNPCGRRRRCGRVCNPCNRNGNNGDVVVTDTELMDNEGDIVEDTTSVVVR
jgi:hypothetical protein